MSGSIEIILRETNSSPDSEDSRLLWAWRNDPVTRGMSRRTEEVSWGSHKDWYVKAMQSNEKVILMGEKDSVKIGMVRFDFIENSYAEININLNPDMRGKGLGKILLLEGCKYGFENLKLGRIYAEIKPENLLSVKIFESAGFTFEGIKDGLRTYSLYRHSSRKEGT